MKTKFIFSILAVAAMSLASCEDTLDETVYSNLTDDTAFTTSENAKAAVNSMYTPLHTIYRTPMFYINDMSTDDCYMDAWSFETLNDNQIATRDELLSAWDGFYKISSRANIAIDRIPEMPVRLFDSEDEIAQLLSEAYFMRAFAYYNLTDIFYQVPLVTSSSVNVSDRLPFASIDEIETQIEKDLTQALKLPQKYATNDDAGRPTVGAAKSMLCKLYMRQAGRARQANNSELANGKWRAALEQANAVLNLEGGVYSLQPSVWDVFDPSKESCIYNNELIFAIRASGNITTGSWDLGLMFTHWEYDMGWNLFSIPLEAAWKFDRADERYTKLMVHEFKDVYVPDQTYYIMPTDISKTGAMSKQQVINGHTYILVNELNCNYSQKYKYLNTGKYIYDTPNNLPVIRLADIILCKAEILNELNGPTQESIDLINRIRERGFKNSSHNLQLSNYGTTEGLRSAICDERLFELNTECSRRPDLIRMGLWKSRMDEYINSIKTKSEWKETNEGKEKGYYSSMYSIYPTDLKELDIRMYMPIPKRETDNNPTLLNARSF